MGLKECPCCGFAISAASVSICTICWWEEIGIPVKDENEVQGGPNRGYSLRQARENFRKHGHMYDADKPIRYLKQESPTRKALMDYIRAIRAGEVELEQYKLLGFIRAEREALHLASDASYWQSKDEDDNLAALLSGETRSS